MINYFVDNTLAAITSCDFQWCMATIVLAGLVLIICFVLFDDVITAAKDHATMKSNVATILRLFNQYNIIVNGPKCTIDKDQLDNVLGYQVDGTGISHIQSQKEKLFNISLPQDSSSNPHFPPTIITTAAAADRKRPTFGLRASSLRSSSSSPHHLHDHTYDISLGGVNLNNLNLNLHSTANRNVEFNMTAAVHSAAADNLPQPTRRRDLRGGGQQQQQRHRGVGALSAAAAAAAAPTANDTS